MIGDRDTNIGDGNYNERVERNVIHAQQVNVIENYVADKTNETSEKEIADRRLAFAIAGSIDQVDQAKLKVIAALLQEISGDASIKIIDVEEGSIKLILEGSPEGLQRLKELFESDELTEIDGIPVEYVHFLEAEISNDTPKVENEERSRLIKEIKTKYVFGRNLRNANLFRADLRDANLFRADLRDANLSGANLFRANLFGANLFRADLIRADLRDAKLRSSNLRDANLSGAELRNANLSFANLFGADLRDAELRNANLSFANRRTTKIDERTKLGRKWRKVWEIVNQDPQGKDLSPIDLSFAYLNGARLIQSNLSFSKLNHANLSQANLIGANLSNAKLLEANLTDADLSGANVENARFGDNLGISGSLKRDLIARGAIFEDSPGERSRVLTPIS